MKRHILSMFICFTVFISFIGQSTIYAKESKSSTDDIKDSIYEDISSSTAANSIRTVDDVVSQWNFKHPAGHAFAAERANNLIDNIKGNNAKVVGDNNIKNGPDRLIFNRDGSRVFIQTKYYATASKSVDACFDAKTGLYKYVDADGNPMQLEVPKNQYNDAVDNMAEKIKQGKVPGVSNPEDASKFVRRGNVTYKQAVNIAKAGTVESLTYDAANGIVASAYGLGIGTVLNYAVLRINGEDREKALKTSAIEGVKTGAGVFATAVIAGQLSKTGALNIFKPSSEALTEALGENFSKKLIQAMGQKVIAEEGESAAMSATKQAARLLQSQVLVAAVTTVVFTIPDAADMFRGRISVKQFVKNFAVTAVSVVAGTAGYAIGGAASNFVVPGIGTIPGGIIGSLAFGSGGALLADKIADYITDDDAYEMYDIIQEQFVIYCEDYIVTEEEANNILEKLNQSLNDDAFKDMYQSKNRKKYAQALLNPLFEEQVSKRDKFDMPSEEEVRAVLKDELKGVIYVH